MRFLKSLLFLLEFLFYAAGMCAAIYFFIIERWIAGVLALIVLGGIGWLMAWEEENF
jgi:hypothetical protein